MTYRTLMIFPTFSNGQLIQDIRDQYDPLAKLVTPHVTLVFPFEDDTISLEQIKTALKRATEGMAPFKLALQGFSRREEYLFLDVVEGQEAIRTLHDRLYQQELFQKHRHPSIPYHPHLTVGRLATAEEAESCLHKLPHALECFETVVTILSVEEIAPDDSSVIIWEHQI